jgi:hypothetical protein
MDGKAMFSRVWLKIATNAPVKSMAIMPYGGFFCSVILFIPPYFFVVLLCFFIPLHYSIPSVYFNQEKYTDSII